MSQFTFNFKNNTVKCIIVNNEHTICHVVPTLVRWRQIINLGMYLVALIVTNGSCRYILHPYPYIGKC